VGLLLLVSYQGFYVYFFILNVYDVVLVLELVNVVEAEGIFKHLTGGELHERVLLDVVSQVGKSKGSFSGFFDT
jgi:hypothetical protein